MDKDDEITICQSDYEFYIGNMLLPVSPEKLTVKIKNGNKTYNLMNEGEINVLKKPGLTEIEFEVLLPNREYLFAVYKNGFQRAKVYLDRLEQLKRCKKPFQFIVFRKIRERSKTSDEEKVLETFNTNITCSLEEYSIVEDAKDNGTDIRVSISLKQYRHYGVKKCKVKKKKVLNIEKLRKSKYIHLRGATDQMTLLENNCYQIKLKKSMTLCNLAKEIYGKEKLYTVIADANAREGYSREKGLIIDKWKKSTKLKKGTKVLVPGTYYI